MDESKAIELFEFFNKEGYDLGDQENFLNSFDDEEKRKELYQFFNKEGYDVGNEEDFVLKKKIQIYLFKRKLRNLLQKWKLQLFHRNPH